MWCKHFSNDLAVGLSVLGGISLLNGALLEEYGGGWIVAGLIMIGLAIVSFSIGVGSRVCKDATKYYQDNPQAEGQFGSCPQAGKYLSIDPNLANVHVSRLPDGSRMTLYSCKACGLTWEQPGDFDPTWRHPH